MLSSWKEIAHFFGKGVRTVQRWEKTLNLPIRRPPGAPSNVVLARTSDLEAWMHRGLGKTAMTQNDAASLPVDEQVTETLVAELETEVRLLVARAGGKSSTTEVPEETLPAQRLHLLLQEIRSSGVVTDHGEHRLRKVA